MKCRKFDRLERELNPTCNFACYRAMFKIANETVGQRVGNFLTYFLTAIVFVQEVILRLGIDCFSLFVDFFGFCLFVFSLNSPFLSSASLSKMFISLTKDTLTGHLVSFFLDPPFHLEPFFYCFNLYIIYISHSTHK